MTKELQITNNWIALHVSMSDRIDTAASLDHAMILSERYYKSADKTVMEVGTANANRTPKRSTALLMVQSRNVNETHEMTIGQIPRVQRDFADNPMHTGSLL